MIDLPFSEPVRLLLREFMLTVERLEVLLCLHAAAGSTLGLEGIIERTGVSRDLALEALRGLVSCGLVAQASSEEPVFSFSPPTEALAQAVEALADAYRNHSAAVLSQMSVFAIERIRAAPMRAFADAFLLGRTETNGDE
jgi:hypothetical protein